jgi:hypothetical protein
MAFWQSIAVLLKIPANEPKSLETFSFDVLVADTRPSKEV